MKGFVLAITLWILTAVTLGASFFALWAGRMIAAAGSDKTEFEQNVALTSTRAVVLYTLSTQRMGINGLQVATALTEERKKQTSPSPSFSLPLNVSGAVISLADQPYYGISDSVFSVQDEMGLIGLNNIHRPLMHGLLNYFDIPFPDRDPMLNKLLDYQDLNNLHRLNGAEAQDYARLGLPPPADRHLFSSWETRRILDWNNYKSLWKDGAFPRLTTVAYGGNPNFNTAPLPVLQALPGIGAVEAERIVANRQIKAFAGLSDVNRASGKKISIDAMSLAFLPGKNQRISLWHPGGNWLREIHVSMTPISANGLPWIIDYEITVPLPDSVRKTPVKNSGIVFFQKEIYK
jgi:DNA uptake protein ComE-like DNA-binding protein